MVEPTGVKWKLAVILAADVEGYSRLIGADEEATHKTLRAYRKIIDGLIARHANEPLMAKRAAAHCRGPADAVAPMAHGVVRWIRELDEIPIGTKFGSTFVVVILTALIVYIPHGAAQPNESLTAEEQALVDHHVFAGTPSCGDLHVRRGYILCYDAARRVPSWVAYKVEPDYLNTPPRKNRFKSFRVDPDIDNEAKDAEYVGLKDARGYARGHLAPYGVMGGDRDGGSG